MKQYTMTFTEEEIRLIKTAVFERSCQLSELSGNERRVEVLDGIYRRIADELKGERK